jgi:NADPH2:quinone reductase
MEGAGIVDAVGEGVTEVKNGDRVAYAMIAGSYAEYAVVPAAKLASVPENLPSAAAASLMLQGMTAHYLTHNTFALKKGDIALVHAAAGGLGLYLVQIAKMLGARVIGTVSTDDKARTAKTAGADAVILYTETDFHSEVKTLTDGRGVDVVYDSVGQSTFSQSLDCLKPRGYLVLLGQSSGPVPPVDPGILATKGSLFLTRPSLAHYLLDREELLRRAKDIFSWAGSGKLQMFCERPLPLSEAAEAHRRLESRKTMGKLILFP